MSSTITKLRSHRIFNIAMFDVIMSIIGIIIIIAYAQKHYRGSYNWKSSIIGGAICAIPLGIFIHSLAGTKTMLNYYLGLSDLPKRD
jgi:hypothetical protein